MTQEFLELQSSFLSDPPISNVSFKAGQRELASTITSSAQMHLNPIKHLVSMQARHLMVPISKVQLLLDVVSPWRHLPPEPTLHQRILPLRCPAILLHVPFLINKSFLLEHHENPF
uniref:Uncharacterized protein n=1 Tax=Arundo donax TaxID=35708 RepID=A0A0A9EH28_ARUDO